MTTLPGPARVKLAAIRQSATDASALAAAALEAVDRLRERRALVARDLMRSDLSPDQRTAVTAEVKALEADIASTEATATARARRRDSDAQVAKTLDAWLARLPAGTVLTVVSVPDVAGVDVTAAIETTRAAITALRTEAQRVKAAPLPMAELSRQVREYVAGLAERGRPQIAGLAGSLTFDWHQRSGQKIDIPAAVAWIDGDRLAARLETEIAGMLDESQAMGSADKEKRLGEIGRQILERGRQEESLIEAAHRLGIDAERRRDSDPLAVLGIEIGETRVGRKRAA